MKCYEEKYPLTLKKREEKLLMMRNSFLLKSLPIKNLVKRKCIPIIFMFGYCFQPLLYEPESLLIVIRNEVEIPSPAYKSALTGS